MSNLVHRLFIPIFAALILISCDSGSSESNQLKFQVEDLEVDKDLSNAWGVTGMIRNLESRKVKGAIKIKFLNEKGDILHSNKAYVNDGDHLKPNQAGSFNYFVSPKEFDGVVDFDIQFYER